MKRQILTASTRRTALVRALCLSAVACLVCCALWSARGRAATNIIVNSASDNVANDGRCTLREAITAANNNAASGTAAGECAAGSSGTDTISFNITDAGCAAAGSVCTIAPTTALPNITQPVTIDGYTQPGASVNTLAVGNNAVLKIELSGQSAPAGTYGLNITGANTTVRGLAINRFRFGSNTIAGIQLIGVGATGNVITGNFIGTNAAGTAALPNYFGIAIFNGATNNRVGGIAAGEANTIAFNGDEGVRVNSGTGNRILSNSTHSNGAFGINLGPDGVTANDAGDGDTGPNNLQNYPVLSSAVKVGATSTVTGTLDSTAGATFRVEFFSNAACDASGHGEGRTYLGALTNVQPNVGFTFSTTTPAVGEFITATATNATTNDTSEFSACRAVVNNAPTASASPSPATTNEDTALTITLRGTDAEDENLSFSITQQPTKGTLSAVSAPNCTAANTCTATVTYTPKANFHGADSFKFRVDDGTSNFGEATVNITVTPVDDTGFVVTTTADTDDGFCDADCSLREAITAAAADLGADTISFNITGAGCDADGVCTITPTTALPTITQPVVMDGYTQPGASANTLAVGNNAVLKIELSGQSAASNVHGLTITGANTTVRGLAINRFASTNSAGIRLTGSGATGNVITGNFIGTNAAGTAALLNSTGIFIIGGATNNRVGTDGNGTSDEAERNIVSGNRFSAIQIANTETSGNIIAGNYVGTNAAGTAALPNGSVNLNATAGIVIIGATNTRIGTNGDGTGDAAERNVVSGNGNFGIRITDPGARDNIIAGNFIGTNAAGTAALPNSFGISLAVEAPNNRIGGIAAGEANTIAFNSNDGIQFPNAGTGNLILSNSIHSNGTTAQTLGIDLGTDGVNANDAGDGDTGPNSLQNFPVLTSAGKSGATTTIAGTLNSNANSTFRVEFFSNASCDTAGNGEGRTFLGFQNVTTDGSGNAAINATLTATTTVGEFVTATATDVTLYDHDNNPGTPNIPRNDTSEFSACRVVVPPNTAPTASAPPNPATTNEDTAVGITLTGTDSEDNNLTFSITQQPTGGTLGSISTPNCAAVNTCTATVTYTPNANYNGADSFKFRVNDGGLNSGDATVTITVVEINDLPIAVNDSKATNKDTTLVFSGSDLTANDSPGPANESDQTLFVNQVLATANTHGQVSLSNGQITYQPTTGYTGAAAFEYVVCDTGTSFGGIDPQCATGTVIITVNAVNDAPTITAALGLSRQQDSAASNSTIATVSDTESGAGGVTVTVTSANPANGVTLANIVNTNGTITANISADCAATNASFTLQASDGSLMSTATLNVAVTANAAPTVGAYPATLVAPGGSTTVTPSAAPADDDSIASITVSALPNFFSGILTANTTTGAVTIANANPPGNYQIFVTVADDCGQTTQRGFTLTVSEYGAGLMFYPLPAPVRLLDTRPGASPNACSQPNAPIAASSSRLQPARNFCSIPANAQAITGHITTVQSGGGYLTLYPSGAVRPTVASTNYAANEIVNNVFTVGLSNADGAFDIYALNTTEVVVDVTGYYAPPGPGGLYFHPLPAPVRLLETRAGQPVGCVKPGTPLAGGADSLQTATTACTGIPAAARALVGNATTVSPQGPGYLTLFPADAARPLSASSNYDTNQIVNGPFTTGLSAAGEFKVFTLATTDLVIDVLGYYSAEANDANGAGLLFTPLAQPVRWLETRAGQAVGCYKPGQPLNGNQSYVQVARGTCDGQTIPAEALAVVGNVTVVYPVTAGYLTLWPSNALQPTTASSNYGAGQIVNRHFIAGLGNADGAFKMFSLATTDLVIDLAGYFAP